MTLFVEKELNFKVNGEKIVVEPILKEDFEIEYNKEIDEDISAEWFSYMIAVNIAVEKYLGYPVFVTCQNIPYSFAALSDGQNHQFYIVCQEFEKERRKVAA